jgi:hypothetical protein
MSSKGPDFEKLGSDNYPQWSTEMLAWLGSQQLKKLVMGSRNAPTPANPAQPTEEEIIRIEAWEDKAEKAAGWIILMITPDQRVHVKSIEDDPIKMWKKLEEGHVVKQAGTRFNTYDDFFSIRKKEDETLQSLTTRIDACMQRIKNLRPENFKLEDLDKELYCMTMIRALPEDYDNFVSSLLIMDKLDKDTILKAFQTEETQRQRRSTTETTTSTKALAASTSETPHPICNHSSHSPSPNPSQSKKECNFCGNGGHIEDDCWKKQKYMKEERKLTAEKKSKRKQEAKKAKEESAGSASLISSTAPPNSITHAWNTDSGATSHMTPHKKWFKTYKVYIAPIRLADNTVVYSAGVGSVEFKPIIWGKEERTIIFHKVLHVPLLGNNLLSILFLTKHQGIKVWIDEHNLSFIKGGKTIFTAEVYDNNTAYLSGTTVVHTTNAPADTAHVTSTLPLDYSLWHRRFAHQNLPDVKKLIGKDWVLGVKLDSKDSPDPICEPCLA